MTTSGSLPHGNPPVGELVNRMSEQITRLVKDELQLAQIEVKHKALRSAVGGGLGGAAAGAALYGLAALVTSAIAAWALLLPVWAAALVVAVIVLVLGGLLALVGVRRLKRGGPLLPSQATASVRQDVRALREAARHDS